VADRNRLESGRRETYRGFESRPLCMVGAETSATVDYRMAPLVVARFVGAYLILFAVVILAGTLAVAFAGLGPDFLVVLLGAGLLGLIALAWWLRTRVAVVRLTAAGYEVRMVRGAGVKEARWGEVEDAVAIQPQGIACVVLRLKDGRSTTIPVDLLAADKDDFARDVRDHLRRAGR
jgi:hypothetical protein